MKFATMEMRPREDAGIEMTCAHGEMGKDYTEKKIALLPVLLHFCGLPNGHLHAVHEKPGAQLPLSPENYRGLNASNLAPSSLHAPPVLFLASLTPFNE
ncbi:hypothetical protein FH972_021764 [Carpinus fangiana]|uniref:Uncharacterized protein n=1 Tax=Carpinus fangiana TaxID=176857 RepID=A0A5N6KQM2_9ROSI|nr:hypothetical protein FH972_021764 [Carpinus fangiana]